MGARVCVTLNWYCVRVCVVHNLPCELTSHTFHWLYLPLGNPDAPSLIELMRTQERTWQEKFQADAQMASARAEQEKQQLARVQEEERRKSMEYNMQLNEEKMKREDQIARQRYV